jgi:hypothetical protein
MAADVIIHVQTPADERMPTPTPYGIGSITPELWSRLRVASESRGVSVFDAVNQAVEAWLKQ